MPKGSPARSLSHIPLANERAVYGAVLGKEAAPGINFSSNPSNEVIASQMILHYLKRKSNPDDALAAVKAWKEPLKLRTIKQVLDENIGATRDAATGKKTRNPDEVLRYTKALKNVDQVDKFLRVGYDMLPASEKNLMRSEVERVLRRIPNVSAYLNHLPSGTTKNECIEQLIKNPNFAGKLRELVNERILGGENGEGIHLEKPTPDAVANQEEAAELKRLKKEELDEITKKITAADTKLKVFEPQGARYAAIQIGASEAEVRRKMDALDEFIKQRDDLNAQGAKVQIINGQFQQLGFTPQQQIEYDDTLKLIKDARRDLKESERKLNEYTSAITDQEKAENKKDSLEERKRQIEEELISLKKNTDTTTLTLTDSMAIREKAEESFVEGIESLVEDAAMQAFEDEVSKAQQTQEELVTKAEEQAKSDEQKAVEEAIKSRYDETITVNPPFGAAREVRRMRKGRIKRDFEMLMSTRGGPEELMRRVLLTTRIPDTSAARIGATRRFTQTEIANALEDPDFMKDMQPQLLQQLITRKLQTGRLRSSDVRVIFESNWADGMIENALQKNQEFATQVETMREQGLIPGPFIEFLRHSRAGSRLSWLMLACGLVPGTLLAPHIVPAIAPSIGKGLASVAGAIPGALPYAAATGAAVAGAQAIINRNAA